MTHRRRLVAGLTLPFGLLATASLLSGAILPANAATQAANAAALPANAAALAPGAESTKASTAATADPVWGITRHAHPLLSTDPVGYDVDLRAFGRMVGDATVVGVGEATHNSHEFFTQKHRLFRYLVREKGFTTFALEGSWSTGLALDRYVVHGIGNPREIMRREFQSAYTFWKVQEYAELIEWMRSYNQTHARKLHFVGNDVGYAGPNVIDNVTQYVARTRPALLAEFTRHYAGIRSDAEVQAWTDAYYTKSLAERLRIKAETEQALALLAKFPASAERTWAIQHARVIAQVAAMFAFDVDDPTVLPKAMKFRDQAMADNTAWWAHTTGAKVLLSAHNGHIAYESGMPAIYEKVQGAFLRETLGDRYLSVGTSFDRGSFNAFPSDEPGAPLRRFTVASAGAASNEFTLDRVPFRDYYVDLRKLPQTTRAWLSVERPTRMIGSSYPFPDASQALASSYDVMIHLNTITAANRLP
ncbi:erythromycin esterase family protein [Kribbella deserti]|uniref:Erythromycin esterase family protein n=1 Tax=Kribbella deserti TaxID=1926257 RepID=A0ABV6QGK9_9ACTN